MTGVLREWILGLAGAAVFCSVCSAVTPEGSVKRVQKLLCGVVMALALISPLAELDMSGYSLNLARCRRRAEEISASAQEISDSLSRAFIEERCAAYILDKARLLGSQPGAVTVRAQWSAEGVWYPVEAEIEAEFDAGLSEKIEEELGIPARNQHWKVNENG